MQPIYGSTNFPRDLAADRQDSRSDLAEIYQNLGGQKPCRESRRDLGLLSRLSTAPPPPLPPVHSKFCCAVPELVFKAFDCLSNSANNGAWKEVRILPLLNHSSFSTLLPNWQNKKMLLSATFYITKTCVILWRLPCGFSPFLSSFL